MQEKTGDKLQYWQEYLDLLAKIGESLENLAELEQNKTKAVATGQLSVVDEIMKKEQAFALTFRGYEQKRVKALEKLEIPPCPLNQLMNHVPRSVHFKAKKVVESVQTKYTLYQTASQVAHSTLEMNLHQIDVLTGQAESPHKSALEAQEPKGKANVNPKEVKDEPPAEPQTRNFRA